MPRSAAINAALAKMAKEQHRDHLRRSREAARLAKEARTPYYRAKPGNRDQFGILMASEEELRQRLARNAELHRAAEWKVLANRHKSRTLKPLKRPARIAKEGHRRHEVIYDTYLKQYRPIKEGVDYRRKS